MRMLSLLFLTIVLLSSTTATAGNHDEVNPLCYRCLKDGSPYMANMTHMSSLEAPYGELVTKASTSNFVSGTAVRQQAPAPVYGCFVLFHGDYTGATCAGSLQKAFENAIDSGHHVDPLYNDVAAVCYDDQHMLRPFSVGDVRRCIANFVSVARKTPDRYRAGEAWLGARCNALCEKGLMENSGPLQMGMPNGKILSTVDIASITVSGFVVFVHCLILTGGGIIQGIKDGKVHRQTGDWHNKVKRKIEHWFSFHNFPTIRNALVYRCTVQPLLPLVILTAAPLLSSTTAGAAGCLGYDQDNMTTRVKPLYYDCGCSGPYNLTKDYYDNRTRLAADLLQKLNTSGSPDGLFANANDTVGSLFGFAHCRGDYRGSVCADSLNRTITDYVNVTITKDTNQITICPSSKELTIYYDQHMLSFSADEYAYQGPRSNRPAWVASNMNYIKNSTDGAAAFYGERVQELLNETARYAASSSPDLYATGKSWLGGDGDVIYGMVQCRPDMGSGPCGECLGDLVGKVPKKFITPAGDHCVGGRILGVWCSLRFEEELFFKETPDTVKLHKPKNHPGKREIILIAIAALLSIVILVFLLGRIIQWKKDSKTRHKLEDWTRLLAVEIGTMFSHFTLSEIRNATDNFSEAKKLGEGAFGPVYRGQLTCGVVAIKRLGEYSSQGLEQFRNEIRSIAKLQHINLVKLIGCCMEQNEKILVYEYMPNRSLDDIFKDVAKWASLTWPIRQHIINGIAQGLLYIHNLLQPETRIVHRDLKASNILLDIELNPKISDFGIAMFSSSATESQDIVPMGTPGYMAPECFCGSSITVKSDVFSFGVLILEIISGRKVATSFRRYKGSDNLMAYAWRLWEDGNCKQLIDNSLSVEEHNKEEEIIRCAQIALLCVQANPEDRPGMAEVITMLSNKGTPLDKPKKPAYFNEPIVATRSNHTRTLYVTAIDHPSSCLMISI
ncbi:hypothetical protein BS78_03G157100 [Paspalum vaginatum]|nr:hypothetical protein BS78_03G157100 [Paspalum vaginatum]